jgi:hypothetical protein
MIENSYSTSLHDQSTGTYGRLCLSCGCHLHSDGFSLWTYAEIYQNSGGNYSDSGEAYEAKVVSGWSG